MMRSGKKVLALASDHAGFRYKQMIRERLLARDFEIADFGTDSPAPTDYPLYVSKAARAVAAGECFGGVVIGGSGNGEAIAANKIGGIRCAVCWNEQSARLAREHNDANMIALGQRLIGPRLAVRLTERWLSATFAGGRHAARLAQIAALERSGPLGGV
jgi:ribose 5-phosphate isomerase B